MTDTRIKLCGLSRISDIEAANELLPDYVGFVFAEKSRRYVNFDTAKVLRNSLCHEIKSVGVFVDEKIENIINAGNIIDLIQLHGDESENYIQELKKHTGKIIIKAFRIESQNDVFKANSSMADYVLFDSGKGTGKIFDWDLISSVERPYFLAGGLNPENVSEAVRRLNPFAVDVSSGIETEGRKDKNKMLKFVSAVRKESKK